MQNPDTNPLICALEGALLTTNLKSERWLQGAKHKLERWLSSKRDLTRLKTENPESSESTLILPFNSELLNYLKAEKANGRDIFLDTSLPAKEVKKILNGKDIFDRHRNYSASNLPDRYDYVGGSATSNEIWNGATEKILVGDSLNKSSLFDRHFELPKPDVKAMIKAIRPHQWLKNLLVFVPIITSQQFSAHSAVKHSVIMFICFSLVASFGYIINDLLDLQSDRVHQKKRYRPFASGVLTLKHAILIGGSLLLLAAIGCAFLPVSCLWVLIGYLTVTICYSLYLKTKLMLDVVSLGGLFTLRVIGGAAAIQTELSFYLLSFSIFLFSSLGMVKRYAELHNLRSQNLLSAHGRGYRVEDMAPVRIIGMALGFMSVFILGQYINSPLITRYYSNPEVVWLLFPLLIYWLGRLWILANRGEVNEDPIMFAIKDKTSLLVAGISAAILLLAD